MVEGKIVTITKERGFGFVTTPSGGDAFFHMSDLEGGLEFDEQLRYRHVRFELTHGERGLRARAIHPAE